jgi:DnaJ-domain-containing protein 1
MKKIKSTPHTIVQLQQIQQSLAAAIQSLEKGSASDRLTLKSLIESQNSLQTLVNELLQRYVQSEILAPRGKRLSQTEKNTAAEALELLKAYLEQ